MPKHIVELNDWQYAWLTEQVEYEIDYFDKLGDDRTEGDTEAMQHQQKLQEALNGATVQED